LQAQYTAIVNSGIRAYIEMPVILPGDATQYQPTVANYYHRLVMYTNDAAAYGLPYLQIFQVS
jgi:hypothetical protein